VSGLYFGGSLLAATGHGGDSGAVRSLLHQRNAARRNFASSFHNVRRLVAMTFVFAAGIATVILPITLGPPF
jgi:cytochrome c-type biogenesis protein